MAILKFSELKSHTGEVLDRAICEPQYIERNGTLLVITKANLRAACDEAVLSPWEIRGKNLENFYNPTNAW